MCEIKGERDKEGDVQMKVKPSDNHHLKDTGSRHPLANRCRCAQTITHHRLNASVKACEIISSICRHRFLEELGSRK